MTGERAIVSIDIVGAPISQEIKEVLINKPIRKGRKLFEFFFNAQV